MSTASEAPFFSLLVSCPSSLSSLRSRLMDVSNHMVSRENVIVNSKKGAWQPQPWQHEKQRSTRQFLHDTTLNDTEIRQHHQHLSTMRRSSWRLALDPNVDWGK